MSKARCDRWSTVACVAVAMLATPMHCSATAAADEGSHPASWTAKPATASPELRKAWDGYYRALDDARAEMERTSIFAQPQNRAKAYHALMEMQAMAYNQLIAPRRTNPRFLVNTGVQTNIYTLGGNGPDSIYAILFLDGAQTYRLKGRLGDIKFFSITVQNNELGEPGNKTIGSYNLANMDVARDGTFEIIVGGPKRPGNWIRLDPNSDHNYLLFRRTLTDWGNSDKGDLSVDRISPIEPGHYDADEFDENAMAARIRSAAQFIRYIPKGWTIGLYDIMMAAAKGHVNAMGLLPGAASNPASEASSNYAMGIFRLKDDEALIVEMDRPPDGAYWSFQLGDDWSRSLDFIDNQTSLNMAQTNLDADGRLRIVISKKDPGIANWLDTTGRKEGQIILRNYGSKVASVPTIRKVRFDEVLADLPAGTKRVTPEQRQAALEHRRLAVLKLYGE